MTTQGFPAWFYGPNGASQVFESEGAVPKGWQDHPSKVARAEPKTETKTPAVTPPAERKPAGSENPAIDADGWPFDPALHAATATKTTAGLWRMKVGVKRPAPKQALDL